MLEKLDDQTLLALMLARTSTVLDPNRTAAALFTRFGCLGAIIAARPEALTGIDGVGSTALSDLKLLRLLCERLARSEASTQPILSSWNILLAYVRIALAEEPREQFRALYLDRYCAFRKTWPQLLLAV